MQLLGNNPVHLTTWKAGNTETLRIDFLPSAALTISETVATSSVERFFGRPDLPRCWSSITADWFHLTMIFTIEVLVTGLLNFFFDSAMHLLYDWTSSMDSITNFRWRSVRRGIVTGENGMLFCKQSKVSHFHPEYKNLTSNFKLTIWLYHAKKIFVLLHLVC